MKCRHCNNTIVDTFVDLSFSPASNSYLTKTQLNEPEIYYPLKIMVCNTCFLVQVDEYKKSAEIFNSEYAYFSSYSTSWLEHCEKYTNKMLEKFTIDKDSLVIEIASNDGYLLQYFKKKNVPVLGIEPTSNTAAVAIDKGIPTRIEFFGETFAKQLVSENLKADLLLGNNVLAHVPDINDFVKGMSLILKPQGVITMEFPHLSELIHNNQFDTIYHEHFSYLSLFTVVKIFKENGLRIFDVEKLSTHGGSLRVYASHDNFSNYKESRGFVEILNEEKSWGINSLSYYKNFRTRVDEVKLEFLEFLITQKREGKSIVGYGAAAKGNTLLNYCGIKDGLIDYIVDANPNKQNRFMPGSHIPIVSEINLTNTKPDFIIILPWNLKKEIISQLSYTREWGVKFVTVIPSLQIID